VNIWLTITLAGLLTYLTRLSFIWLFERISVPRIVERALRFVPLSVLAVIIFQEVLIRDGALALSLDNTRLLAALVAVVVAWTTRSPLLTIGVGMAALLALKALMG